MAFNIREFQSNISSLGYLQTNAYEVVIPLPKMLANKGFTTTNGSEGSYDAISRVLTTRSDRVTLPGVNLMTSDVFRYGIGTSEKKPFNAQFTDVTMQFIGDREGFIWTMFYNWINSIYGFAGNENTKETFLFEYKDNYSTNVLLRIYNKYGDQTIDVNFQNAFPVSLVEVPLSWQDRSNMMRIQVVFNFRNWFSANSRQEAV